MSHDKPYVSLVSTASKRAATLELAAEIERRGFPGIAVPSLGDTLALCTSLAHVTSSVHFVTAIQPIYRASANEVASTAAYLHEVSGGRFSLGLGVSHEAMNKRVQGANPGQPLSDMRDYVAALRASERFTGALPPVLLATLRDRMLGLATEVAQGALWANCSRRAIAGQLDRVPGARADGFWCANMIPCVIDDDRRAAAAINRRTMATYVGLPNYRNAWRAAGYVEEMDAIEAVLASGERDRLPEVMSDTWLADCTLFGSAADVREGLTAWRETGVEPIAVMSSTSGGQHHAIRQLFDAYA
jgi:alkanesulfonate monooxygenase SsuD/methylene tetrahydromethanopterin reductase-like flavin-dependent oxidoreductase (luciferase family)